MAHTTVKETIKTAPEFTKLIDLASERLGGKVLFATDDFFAEKENLLKPGRGIFITDKYTDRGKWMDGWESRRKRTPGHDWAIVQLATSGKITGFDIDTNFFLGNHPPHASVNAVNLIDADFITDWENVDLNWQEILPKSHLDAGSQNFYESQSNEIFTHLRLHMYPDGGIARFKVYGDVFKNWDLVTENEETDLVAAENGGLAIDCNDMFFSAMGNLIMPGRGINMGDGWETKRNRTPNNRDWVILKLGKPGSIERIIVDTCHFKGNYPDSCLIEACHSVNNEPVIAGNVDWKSLLPQQKLSADHIHEYKNEICKLGEVSHVRLNIFPDGGISRLRLFGKIKN
ncbi:MAG: allantoicase [Saprospiraceae bacterium]